MNTMSRFFHFRYTNPWSIPLAIVLLTGCKDDDEDEFLIDPCGIDFNTTVHYLAVGDGFSSGQYLSPADA